MTTGSQVSYQKVLWILLWKIGCLEFQKRNAKIYGNEQATNNFMFYCG